jgi:hypothetical protein
MMADGDLRAEVCNKIESSFRNPDVGAGFKPAYWMPVCTGMTIK